MVSAFSLFKFFDQILEVMKLLDSVSRRDLNDLKSELERMERLLNYVHVEDKTVSEIVVESAKICSDIEDSIETYAVDAANTRKGGILAVTSYIWDIFSRRRLDSDLSIFKEQIRDLNSKLELCSVNKTPNQVSDLHTSAKKLHRDFDFDFWEGDFVGMEEEMKRIESQFQLRESPIICIYGMGGLGKTTLARMIYSDKGIRRQFDAFAWVSMGQELHMKSLLQDVLLQLNPSSREEVLRSMDLELAQKLYKSLQSRKCLIVLDDMTKSAWDNMKICLPTDKSSSRILITTRTDHVAKRIADKGVSIEMKTLSVDDSWLLFLKKLSTDFKADQALEEIGKDVVKKCGGLPLAIVTIGNVLKREQTNAHWSSVLKALDSSLVREQNFSEFSSIPKGSRLSYEYLPYHLRNCFLYTGMFPKDPKIEVKKLINLWVAEGL